jgi:hypothetical protein
MFKYKCQIIQTTIIRNSVQQDEKYARNVSCAGVCAFDFESFIWYQIKVKLIKNSLKGKNMVS